MLDRKRQTAPLTISFAALQRALQTRYGADIYVTTPWGGTTYHVPGDGCPCADCSKEREALLKEINAKVHEDHQRMIHACCPQRAAHDLNALEAAMPQNHAFYVSSGLEVDIDKLNEILEAKDESEQ